MDYAYKSNRFGKGKIALLFLWNGGLNQGGAPVSGLQYRCRGYIHVCIGILGSVAFPSLGKNLLYLSRWSYS